MADLLLELFSEEIPARMQRQAGEDLARLVGDGLRDAGLTFERAEAHSGPRRLTLHIEGLPAKSADVREERKGPRVGAPEKAIEGFLRSAGLASLGDAQKQSDAKGEFYVAIIERSGVPAAEIVARVVADVVRKFPWPKSMRWGGPLKPSGESVDKGFRLRWVRPLHSILCLIDGKPVAFEVDGVKSGGWTLGHRFLSPGEIAPKNFGDYQRGLAKHKVIVARDERLQRILTQARDIAASENLMLVEDQALLEENAGLAEWPVALSGRFDDEFLDVPPEALMTAMKAHQKCFSLRGRDGALANRFILVSNLEAQDGGRAIIAGNERVIRARLSDAKFFWENDKRRGLARMRPKLDEITFHEKLGTQGERVERIAKLARELAPLVGADPDKAARAAELCKADLVSETVGEFPELQGVIGRYLALAAGEDASVADAITEHYKPQGQGDSVPTNPVSIAVALADKLDMLVGFWAIDEKPTGSKDPYALRRAALGVIRMVLENNIQLKLLEILPPTWDEIAAQWWRRSLPDDEYRRLARFYGTWVEALDVAAKGEDEFQTWYKRLDKAPVRWYQVCVSLEEFFLDRLKVYLRDQGARHNLIDAVIALSQLPDQDDLLMIVRRVEALGRFLETDDGANLLAGVKRAANILRIEEKKDGRTFDGAPSPALLKEPEEKALAKAVAQASADIHAALAESAQPDKAAPAKPAKGKDKLASAKTAGKASGAASRNEPDFEAAMAALAKLRAPVDAFFERVTVNVPEAPLRENRLKLLAQIRAATLAVADFAKIEG